MPWLQLPEQRGFLLLSADMLDRYMAGCKLDRWRFVQLPKVKVSMSPAEYEPSMPDLNDTARDESCSFNNPKPHGSCEPKQLTWQGELHVTVKNICKQPWTAISASARGTQTSYAESGCNSSRAPAVFSAGPFAIAAFRYCE